MIRGTTPTLTFNIPFETSIIKSCYVTIEQHPIRAPKIIIEKSMHELTVSGRTISLMLTQENTLSFKEGYGILVQLRVLTNEGKALASDIYKISCEDILKDGVIS